MDLTPPKSMSMPVDSVPPSTLDRVKMAKVEAALAPLTAKLDELGAKMRPAKTAAAATEQTPILQPAKA